MNQLPPVKTMYRASLNRDSSYEGIFYVGVKTTGVFCRPTCTAKNPEPENIEYFASPQAAQAGGYRPCKRCRPLDKEHALPESVRRLFAAVEQSSTGKLSERLWAQCWLWPATMVCICLSS
jgi:AraC family transcriptional regulator of adaptative response/methylated-DNA-[protein]-cysteine methyltransferase